MKIVDKLKKYWNRNNDIKERENERHDKILELRKNQMLLTTVVIGVSGSGKNMINYLLEKEPRIRGVSIYRKDKVTEPNLAQKKIVVENEIPSEKANEIRKAIVNASKVYIVSGLGGITGSNLLVPIAKIVHETGVETKIIVTKPFMFEGRRRRERAELAIKRIVEDNLCDSILIAHNDSLIDYTDKDTPLAEAFGILNDNICSYILDGEKCDTRFFSDEIICNTTNVLDTTTD